MSRPDENRIRDFFCEAMMCGWVSGAEPLELHYFPGYKCYEHRDGPFRLIDTFCSGEDQFAELERADEQRASSGQTTIWYVDKPIWVMSYSGQYPSKAIHFLKSVLWAAYSHRCTRGGRGVHYYGQDDLSYTNLNDQFGSNDGFADSSGTEYIYEAQPQEVASFVAGHRLGYHHYRCLLL